MTPLELAVSRLEAHDCRPRKSGDGFTARCPAHEDRKASLSVSEGKDRKVLLKCFAGCAFADIVAALGLEEADAFPPSEPKTKRNGSRGPAPWGRPIRATFPYHRAEGALLFEQVRFDDATDDAGKCAPRHRDTSGRWSWTSLTEFLNGAPIPLYRLPGLREAVAAGRTIFLPEGERDAETLRALGLDATTNYGGADGWRAEYAEELAGADVVVLPDNDPPGERHAEAVVRSLRGRAKSVRVLRLPSLPPKGDVSDWVAAGGTREDLEAMVAALLEEEDRTAPAEPSPVLIAEAFEEPVPEIAWIAEGLIPTGVLVLLAAFGGTGKTTLLMQLCACLAAGRDFLGFHVPQAIPTLYLIAEGSRHVFLDRVRVALARMGIDAATLPLWITPREFRAEIGPTLDKYIEKTGARLIVLDTVGLFHDGDENSASDFKAKVVKPLREIMARRDVSFVLVTHEVKPNAERKGRHRVRGTSALVDDSDVAIRLEAPEGDRATPRLLIFEKIRTGAAIDPVPLEFSPSFAIFERVGEDTLRERQAERAAETDARRLRDLEAQVVKYLKRDPDGLTKAELTAELHPRRADLVRVLDRLRDESRAFPDRDPKGRAMRWKLAAAPRLEVAV